MTDRPTLGRPLADAGIDELVALLTATADETALDEIAARMRFAQFHGVLLELLMDWQNQASRIVGVSADGVTVIVDLGRSRIEMPYDDQQPVRIVDVRPPVADVLARARDIYRERPCAGAYAHGILRDPVGAIAEARGSDPDRVTACDAEEWPEVRLLAEALRVRGSVLAPHAIGVSDASDAAIARGAGDEIDRGFALAIAAATPTARTAA